MDIRYDDGAITAEAAKAMGAGVTDDSLTRDQFREVMKRVKYRASYGYTSATFLFENRPMYMEVVDAIRKLGYTYSDELFVRGGAMPDQYIWTVEW